MITLYTFGPAFGLPDPSPFVTKVELLLKLAALPYRTAMGDLRKAPKGKLPYIEDDGTHVADSTLIRWHIEKKYGIDFDQGLSQVERGIAWSIEKMLEDHLYWAVLESRWLDDQNFAKGPAQFFRRIPALMRPFIQKKIRGKVRNALKAHGMGRHTAQEIVALATKDIESIAAILSDKPYLMGQRPCSADAAAFAFIHNLLCPHFDTPIRTVAETHPNLLNYSTRIGRQYFPDFIPNL